LQAAVLRPLYFHPTQRFVHHPLNRKSSSSSIPFQPRPPQNNHISKQKHVGSSRSSYSRRACLMPSMQYKRLRISTQVPILAPGKCPGVDRNGGRCGAKVVPLPQPAPPLSSSTVELIVFKFHVTHCSDTSDFAFESSWDQTSQRSRSRLKFNPIKLNST
jgi:hypothetical protein